MTVFVLTWLWQGLALAAATAVVLRLVSPLNASTRHAAWWTALGGILVLGWLSIPELGRDDAGALTNALAAQPRSSALLYLDEAPRGLVPLVAGIWAALALARLVRVVFAVRGIFAFRDACRPFPPQLERQLPLWCDAKQRGRGVTLALCDAVPSATMLGFYRPVIAVPSALAGTLTPDELDQVVLHEHAHALRRDDWTRLLQAVVDAFAGLHPAVAFASRSLSRERELACDEWVIARTQSPRAYVRCLARAAEASLRRSVPHTLAPAFTGTAHDLVRRVDRLLRLTGLVRPRISFSTAAVAAVAVTSLVASMAATRVIADVRELRVLVPGAPARVQGALALVMPAGPVSPAVSARQRPAQAVRDDAPVAAATQGSSIAMTPRAEVVPASNPSPAPAPAPSDRTDAPPLLSRAFAPAYEAPGDPDTRQRAAGWWRSSAEPGIQIAAAARKSGVSIAGTVGRAGIAVARTF